MSHFRRISGLWDVCS